MKARNRQRAVSEEGAAPGGAEAAAADADAASAAAASSGAKRTRADAAGDDPLDSYAPKAKKPHPTGIKKHSRYDPGVPMDREQLKAWRKEARRVRNRESAAASRQRNRDRIGELESELGSVTSRYHAALRFIAAAERQSRKHQRGWASFVPAALRRDLASLDEGLADSVSPRPATPPGSCSAEFKTVSPPLSPTLVSDPGGEELRHLPQHRLQDRQDRQAADRYHQKHQPHVMDTISRPIACV